MKAKKLLAIVAASAMMLTAFTACNNGGGSGDSGDSGDGKEVVELTLTYNAERATNTDLMVEEFYKAVDAFNENSSESGVKVNMEVYPSDQYETKINAFASANDMPDLVYQAPGKKLWEYAEAGKYVDLKPYLEADQEWYDSFVDGAFVNTEYKDGIYAMPLNLAFACVFYNTEIFDEVGVVAADIKTWDDLVAASEKIKAAGYTPLTVSVKDAWCVTMIASYLAQRIGGMDPINAITNRDEGYTFNQDCFIQAATLLKDYVDAGYVQSSAVGDANDMATAYFKSGEASMLVQGSWAIGGFHEEGSKIIDKVGVFSFPTVAGGKGEQNRWMGKTDNIAMGIDGEHYDECIVFLKHMSGDDLQKATAEIAGKVPITKVDYDASVAPKEMQYVTDLMESEGVQTMMFFDEAFGNAFGTEWNNAIAGVITGTKTPEQAMSDLQAYCESAQE